MSVRSFALLAALMPLLMVGCGTNVSTAARAATLPVQFLHYAQMGLPEQDVYVEPYSWLDDLPSNFIYPLRPPDIREEIPSNFTEPRSILAPAVVRGVPRLSALHTRRQPDAEGNAALRLRIPVLPHNEREQTIVHQLVYER